MPALVCAGRFDGIAPLANAEALAEQIPGANLQVFDGGHAFLLQDRSRVARHRALLVVVGRPQDGQLRQNAGSVRAVRRRRRTARTSGGTA